MIVYESRIKEKGASMGEGIRAEMASGKWFEAGDLSLAEDRAYASSVMRKYNYDQELNDEERTGLLRELFGAFGDHSSIAPGLQVDYGYNVFIGERCFINYNCSMLDGAPITFGDDVWVGPQVVFATALHPLLAEERNMRIDVQGEVHLWERSEEIRIGNGVWIASNATINPGVTIGDGAVIGAGSVVTKDIPAGVLAFGSPCKPVRAISEADHENLPL